MKLKSLIIKQFFYSYELGVGLEELYDCCVVVCRIMMEIQDVDDYFEIVGYCYGGGYVVDDCFRRIWLQKMK